MNYLTVHCPLELCVHELTNLSISQKLKPDLMEPYSQLTHSSITKDYLELVSEEINVFFKAVEDGNLRVAKLLHNRHGVDPEARNVDGRTPLQLASIKGHYDLVEWLLIDAKVDVNHPDSRGYCAVHYAVLGCKVRVLKMLLENGAKVNPQNEYGETALHIAVMRKMTQCLITLMNYGADFNLQDLLGNTPIHIALMSGRAPCLELILPRLRPSFNFQLRNKKGFSVVHIAVVQHNSKAIEFFMKEKNILNHLLIEKMPNFNCTALHYACYHKNYQMAKLLLNGSSIFKRIVLEARNQNGMSALLIACLLRDYAIIELLVQAGANVKAVDSRFGNGAILLATSSPDLDKIPSKELSPGIFKIYQIGMKSTDIKRVMERHPILALIAYLMSKGAPLDRANKFGRKFIDAFPKVIIEMLNKLAFNQTILLETECIKWIGDGTQFGFIEDQLGFRFDWIGTRADGSVHYRCSRKVVDLSLKSKMRCCSAVAIRVVKKDGTLEIGLNSGHSHSLVLKRKPEDEGRPSLTDDKKRKAVLDL